VLGLSVAYWLRYLAGRWRAVVFGIIVGTMFASFLVRVYAWRTLLGTNGVINSALQLVGITEEPLSFLIFSRFAVIITQVNVFLPFAILMFYAGFAPLQQSYLEAAQDLGANAFRRWTRVILPALAAPIVMNVLFTLVLAASDYVTPQFVGGTSGSLLGSQIASAFRTTGIYPLAAALSMLTLVAFAICYGVATLGLRLARLDRLRWVG
jgi:spermidine/putrescine transport system permease protein